MSEPGDIVDGRFELLQRLGSGGMGTVWRARDTTLHREVALKEVRPPDPAFSTPEGSRVLRERVLREARSLARISHPHVVTIHQIVDTGPESLPWIAMELVPGRNLQDRLDQGGLLPHEAAALGRQILSALRAAHAAGIQHRDVKPANILLRDDATAGSGSPPSAVLTDFGIAALQGSTALTATGDLIGSPEYIAPERIRGTDDDPASDLWSLGLVLYVAVEGRSPLRRGTTLATLAAVLDEPVPPPVRSGPLAPVLQALLVRDPAARPDAARLDVMLAEAAAGVTPHWGMPTMTASTPPPSVPGGPPPPTQLDSPRPAVPGTVQVQPRAEHPRRRTALLMTVVATVAAAVTATALVLALREGSDTPPEDGRGGGTASSAQGSDGGTGGSGEKSPDGDGAPTPTRSPEESAGSSSPESPQESPSTEEPEQPDPEQPPASGAWIAQLFSEPTSSGAATRDRRLAAVRKDVPNATYLRSDDYASLRPGYWVIYEPGPFDDGHDAVRFCSRTGRDAKNECVGRYLSDDKDEFGILCQPPASNPSGRCEHD